jgi:two-component system cell cycle sensor histidine kinase/response regulator CckA
VRREALRAAGIALDVVCRPSLPQLWADGPQLQQALLNLLLNAERALDQHDHPSIIIRVFQGRAAAGPPTIYPAVEPGPMPESGAPAVVIDIVDNGPGLPEQVRERLFEPFVTTRPVGQGTGLGLATAYGIVAQHGGSMYVASAAGQGTSFRIVLPYGASDTPAKVAGAPKP